jgi:hypothetical protein
LATRGKERKKERRAYFGENISNFHALLRYNQNSLFGGSGLLVHNLLRSLLVQMS